MIKSLRGKKSLVLASLLVMATITTVAYAAVGPTATPPGGTVVPNFDGLTVSGNVGIGTTTPTAKLDVNGTFKITDGNQAAGKVLTSDAAGFAGWADPTGGGGSSVWTTSGNNIYNSNTGNVGIGATSPSAKLTVSAGNNSLALFGPNATWGGSLFVGSGPDQNVAGIAQVLSSDGSLHIDPAAGKHVYIGFRQPGTIFLNSNGGNVGIGLLPSDPIGAKLQINGQIKIMGGTPGAGKVLTSDATGLATWETVAGGGGGGGSGSGDLTAINAGDGITVTNGTGPIPTVAANPAEVQSRVTGTCPSGSSIRVIGLDGTVTCEPDDVSAGGGGGDVTDVLAGTGITVTNSAGPQPSVAVNTTSIQSRVSSSCAEGSSIRAIASNGTVTCEPDDNTGGSFVETDPQVGTLTSGQWCKTNGTNINCIYADPTVTETDPQVGTLTSGQWCKTNGTTVNCVYDNPAETDPQVGTLTNGKWCTTNGTDIDCTSNAPITTELDPQVGTLANGKWCKANGSEITCTFSDPTFTETDPHVGTGQNNQIAVFGAGNIVRGSSGLTFDASQNLTVGNGLLTKGGLEVMGAIKSHGTISFTSSSTSTKDLCYSETGGYKEPHICSSSSQRYKNHIETLGLGLSEVMKMRPVTFYYNEGASEDRSEQVGFIAEEIEKITPLLVEYKDGLVENVKYKQMPSILAKAIQELKVEKDADVGGVKSEIAQLKSENKAMKGFICEKYPEAEFCK